MNILKSFFISHKIYNFIIRRTLNNSLLFSYIIILKLNAQRIIDKYINTFYKMDQSNLYFVKYTKTRKDIILHVQIYETE